MSITTVPVRAPKLRVAVHLIVVVDRDKIENEYGEDFSAAQVREDINFRAREALTAALAPFDFAEVE